MVVPPYAAQVGLVVAVLAGLARRGVLLAWLVALAPNLAYLADDAFPCHAGWSVAGRIGHFLDPAGLAYLGIVAVAARVVREL